MKNINRTVHGVGFIGIGPYMSKISGKQTEQYRCWKAIMARCYYNSRLESNPSYNGCKVCEEWHNFQVFAKWYEDTHIPGYELDKDLLVTGNKVYGPNNCCWLPKTINSFIKSNYSNKGGGLPVGVVIQGKKYYSTINFNGKARYLGMSDTPEIAHNKYLSEQKKIFGEAAEIFKDKITNVAYEKLIQLSIN